MNLALQMVSSRPQSDCPHGCPIFKSGLTSNNFLWVMTNRLPVDSNWTLIWHCPILSWLPLGDRFHTKSPAFFRVWQNFYGKSPSKCFWGWHPKQGVSVGWGVHPNFFTFYQQKVLPGPCSNAMKHIIQRAKGSYLIIFYRTQVPSQGDWGGPGSSGG